MAEFLGSDIGQQPQKLLPRKKRSTAGGAP